VNYKNLDFLFTIGYSKLRLWMTKAARSLDRKSHKPRSLEAFQRAAEGSQHPELRR
jgi:hypothetical protein